MITIWFEPHATSLDNEAGLASGWNDVDLSPKGLEQSHDLVERCLTRGIDVIFTSDLQRAVKTAIPLSDSQHVPIYADARLRECNYGDMTQKPKRQVEVEKPKRISTPFANGESYEDCVERMSDFFEFLNAEFDGKTVLIIGHRATQYAIEHILLGKSIELCVTEAWQWQPGWQYELT